MSSIKVLLTSIKFVELTLCSKSLDGVEMFGLTSPAIVQVKKSVGTVITWNFNVIF